MKFSSLLFVALAAKAAEGLMINQADPGPCCKVCGATDDEIKTYSIDTKHGHCGEACIHPNDFWKYKIFEPGLTKCDKGNATPCADNGYTNYTSTDTHGFPGVLSIQLDFYDKPTKDEDD